MSRVEKFGRARGKAQRGRAAIQPPAVRRDSNSADALPPRRKKHPSNAHKITQLYYNFLFFLFVCLVAGLFWYGIKFTK